MATPRKQAPRFQEEVLINIEEEIDTKVSDTSKIQFKMADKSDLVKKRGIEKGRLTNFAKWVEDWTPIIGITPLKLRISKIEECFSKFSEIQAQIICIDDDHSQYLEGINFETSYFNTMERAHSILEGNPPSTPPPESPQQITYKTPVSLPKIELKPFFGDYSEWTSFHDLFDSLIIKNRLLSNVQKLYYLKSVVKGSAFKVIESITLTDDNFQIAWSLLQKRYSNKHIIVNELVQTLYNQPKVEKESLGDLRQLLETTQRNVNSLAALNEPVDQWDTMLVHLIASKLDSITRRAWELEHSYETLPKFSDIVKFLTTRCQMLETISLSKDGTNSSTVDKPKKQNSKAKPYSGKFSFLSKQVICSLCSNNHQIFECKKFKEMTVSQRKQHLIKTKSCFNCLKSNHFVKNCTSSKCKTCGQKHNTLLHQHNIDQHKQESHSTPVQENSNASVVTNTTITHVSMSNQRNYCLLPTAIVKVQHNDGQWKRCRCLIDSGSQSNIMSLVMSEQLQLPINQVNIPILGVNGKMNTAHYQVKATISSNVNKRYQKSIDCLVLPSITTSVPAVELNTDNLILPEDISLADPTFDEPGRIDLLLGSDIFWEILQSGSIALGPNRPNLRATKLGWIATGSIPTKVEDVNSFSCHLNVTQALDEQLQKFWSIEDIQSDQSSALLGDAECEMHFINSVTRDDSGRYTVSLPRNNHQSLGSSKETAFKKMYMLENKLRQNDELYEQYRDFMQQYEELHHMTEINDSEYENQEHYFIPHFPVIRQTSESTPLRVVFNASQPTTSGASLNDTLLVGPNIQNDLISVLLRFRTYNYAIVGDISKFFRQINIEKEQRKLQLICWRKYRKQPMKIFQLNTVTYGMSSSPYLAARTLKQLYIDEGYKYSMAANSIDNWYMDDFLGGGQDLQSVIQLRAEITSLLKSGGFHICKWVSNNETILDSIPSSDKSPSTALEFNDYSTVRTLGMIWHPKQDLFSYSINSSSQQLTKRTILSEIASIFDPLGLIAPVITCAKIIMQQLWLANLQWDQTVTKDIQDKWIRFRQALQHLTEIKIPRTISVNSSIVGLQLHIFGDASLHAYGSCAYIRASYSDNRVTSRLLIAKGKVAPLKTITLPKLELSAALLSSVLAKKIKCLQFHLDSIMFWSDSSIVLSWLCKQPKHLEVFVANRVVKILEVSSADQWRYVPSQDNPADVISRGETPGGLKDSDLWFQGPHWLTLDESLWPSNIVQTSKQNTSQQLVNVVTLDNKWDILSKYSSMHKLNKVMAYCKRFISNSKLPKDKRQYGHLTSKEMYNSWKFILSQVQEEAFKQEIKTLLQGQSVPKGSPLANLNPFLDREGLLRVGGRIQSSNLSYDSKHPIILPSKHKITDLIIREEHFKNLHAGVQLLSCILRQRVWILASRKTIRSVLQKCTVCFRTKPKLASQLMGQLPKDRLQPHRPFLVSGVDMAGPILLKQGNRRNSPIVKAYIAIFVCLAIKAVHIELVPNLSTDAFINAFRRFISRRGKCSTIFSDNGTNFVGADKELKELRQMVMSEQFQQTVLEAACSESIEWKFIPPYSPHQGGLFEAAVKQAKYHLRRVIGTNVYTYDQFNTLLTQVEACLNSRPLTPLSNDPNDMEALTPGHFLIGESLKAFPEPDITHIPENRLDSYQQVTKMYHSFWKRWSHEYLSTLQTRPKWNEKHPNLHIGQLVLVEDQNQPPMKWKLGRISDLHPGKDHCVRVVSIKTTNGNIKRSIQHIAPLPTEDGELLRKRGRDVGSPSKKMATPLADDVSMEEIWQPTAISKLPTRGHQSAAVGGSSPHSNVSITSLQ